MRPQIEEWGKISKQKSKWLVNKRTEQACRWSFKPFICEMRLREYKSTLIDKGLNYFISVKLLILETIVPQRPCSDYNLYYIGSKYTIFPTKSHFFITSVRITLCGLAFRSSLNVLFVIIINIFVKIIYDILSSIHKVILQRNLR